jgi:hypothetical protein
MAKTKAFLSTFLIALMISGLAFVGSMHFSAAQSGTDVSYIIGSDTTWTQSNSPYNFIGNVLVNNGITLTIGTGVTVNLNSYYLRVNGSLIIQPGATINMELIGPGIQVNGVLSAIGTSANPIYINGGSQGHNFPTPFYSYSVITFSSSSTGWNQQINSGSIMENTIINCTEIDVSSEVKISSNSFLSGSLTLLGDSPTIVNNNLASGLNLIDGISVGQATKNLSPVISSNDITGGLYIQAGSGIVDDNTISGITIDDAYGSPISTLIERNLISKSSIGISSDIQSSNNNEATIENNTVTNNAVGIQIGTLYAPAIVDNNIYGNSLNAKLSEQASSEINLINNWWGTTDQQAINQTIYDFKDDFTLGTVNFVPFLTAPNSEAMPNPNTSIPTPAPNSTQSSSPSPTTTSSSSPSASQSQQSTASLPIELIVAAVVIVMVVVAIGAFLLGKRTGRK